MKFLKNIFFTAALTLLVLPMPAFAQFDNPLKSNLSTIAGFTEAFLKALIFIMFPIAVVFIVYSGFLFVLAQGKPEDLSKAKMNFFWTIIGISLLLGAWALSILIKGTIEPLLG